MTSSAYSLAMLPSHQLSQKKDGLAQSETLLEILGNLQDLQDTSSHIAIWQCFLNLTYAFRFKTYMCFFLDLCFFYSEVLLLRHFIQLPCFEFACDRISIVLHYVVVWLSVIKKENNEM